MAYSSWSVVFGEQPSAAKWNILGTNDASFNDGTGIGASAITPEKLFTGTGTTWPWTTYTPTQTGWSSTTILTARYRQIGKNVEFVFDVSGTSNATTATLTVPVAAKLTASIFFEGFLTATSDNGSAFNGSGKIFLDPSSSATVASLFSTTTGTGWTAANTKAMRGTLIYEAN